MHQTIFAELSIIIAIGAGMALIMRAIRQPLIIGHILTGIIVGPSLLHLVNSTETIATFSTIGIALLLFIIGLGLNPRVVKEVGKVATIAGLLQVGITAALGAGVGLLLGFTQTEAALFGVALAFSSTIIILKLLSDKKEQSRLYGKIIIGILLVQDILAALALLLVTSKAGAGFSPGHFGELFLKGALVAIPFFLVAGFILPKLHKFMAGSPETLFLFAIGWGFGSAALFEQVGFSLEIGALLAGISLSTLPYAQEISARLRPLRDFFIVVFFIALGTRLSFDNLGLLIPAILMGSFIVIVVKPLVIMTIMGYMGYTKRTSFNAAVAAAQVSEFSLVMIILANSLGLISGDLVAILTFIALVTIAVSAYLIVYSDSLFAKLDHHIDFFERKKTKLDQDTSHHHELLLFGYKKGGHEFLKVFQAMEKRYAVIDYDPEVIDILEHQKIPFVYGDVNDIELLDEVGISSARLIVSVITDLPITKFLLKEVLQHNPRAVFICHADTVPEADELYSLGASYVMLPHYIGSEKIGAFIKKSGLKKSEFKRYREKHQAYLHSHYQLEGEQ